MHLASTLSRSALKNVHAAVHTWHLINRLQWNVDAFQLGKAFDSIKRMAPAGQDKCALYTIHSLFKILATLDSNNSLDAAVYVCACILF